MTGMDYVREACPVPWYPTPAIDFALWWMWPEVLRRLQREDDHTLYLTLEEIADRFGIRQACDGGEKHA